MRVVDRATFLALPAGTIFCKGGRWYFEGLSVKGRSTDNDWYSLDPAWAAAEHSETAFDLLETSLEQGRSFEGEFRESRDGCYDDNDIFLIFERPDLLRLREHIERAIAMPLRFTDRSIAATPTG